MDFVTQITQAATQASIATERVRGMSLNDHPAIREAFEGFHIETIDINYIVGGADRPTARKEVIIFSWDDKTNPAGLF